MIAILERERPVCPIEGCSNHRRPNGKRINGESKYSSLCNGHMRLRRLNESQKLEQGKREDGEALVQGECVITGCYQLQESKGIVSGKRRYNKLCSAHRQSLRGRRKAPVTYHRQPNADPNLFIPNGVSQTKWLAALDMGTCAICGWKGPCDKHRIRHAKDGGKYHKGNVMVICPNCHRLIHSGRIELK